jgi:hypothetical protein
MNVVRILQVMCAVLSLPLTSLNVFAGDGGAARHTGNIQSVRASDGTLMIEELGTGGVSKVLDVGIRRATVVRIWRDPADPWTWRERLTSIYRWPVGTYVVVIGRRIDKGSVEASRIEIPKVMSE